MPGRLLISSHASFPPIQSKLYLENAAFQFQLEVNLLKIGQKYDFNEIDGGFAFMQFLCKIQSVQILSFF